MDLTGDGIGYHPRYKPMKSLSLFRTCKDNQRSDK